MRGKLFHNRIVNEAGDIFIKYDWQVYTEHLFRSGEITTFFDLFAVRDNLRIACEIETTARHAVDNIIKALATGIYLWVIVPTRDISRKIEQKLSLLDLDIHPGSISILLNCNVEEALLQFHQNYI
jgi:hypothetical protein